MLLPPAPSGPAFQLPLYHRHFTSPNLALSPPFNQGRRWVSHCSMFPSASSPHLGLVAPESPTPTQVPKASLHGHHSRSPSPQWPRSLFISLLWLGAQPQVWVQSRSISLPPLSPELPVGGAL